MKIKRFSNIGQDLGDRLDLGADNTLNFAEDMSSRLLNDKNLGKTRGVKRWGRLVNNTSKLLKRRKKNELDNGK